MRGSVNVREACVTDVPTFDREESARKDVPVIGDEYDALAIRDARWCSAAADSRGFCCPTVAGYLGAAGFRRFLDDESSILGAAVVLMSNGADFASS